MGASRKVTPKKLEYFLDRLRETGNVYRSALSVGLLHPAVYKQRNKDPEFARAWDEALNESVDFLVEEAKRRAYDGVDEPVFYQGEVCGTVRKYSDPLLMFLIKGIRKEYATERKELTGSNGQPLKLEVVTGIPRAPNEKNEGEQCLLTQDTGRDAIKKKST